MRFGSTRRCAALIVCALGIALAGCSEERVDPAPTSLAPSMKGYELYSWRDGQTWVFKRMVGTDRTKTLEEVTSDGTSAGTAVLARGIKPLKAAFGQLPDGARVVWRRPEATERMGIGPGDLALPPPEIIRKATAHAEQAGVSMEVLQQRQVLAALVDPPLTEASAGRCHARCSLPVAWAVSSAGGNGTPSMEPYCVDWRQPSVGTMPDH